MDSKQKKLNIIDNIPKHIAIVPDGNRRWSMLKFGNKNSGHKEGMKNILRITKEAMKYNIKYITFYVLSIENLQNRDHEEIFFLLNLLKKLYNPAKKEYSYNRLLKYLNKEKIQVNILGNIDNMATTIKEKFNKIGFTIPEDIHRINSIKIEKPLISLQLCINYSAQDEIVEAFKKIYYTKRDNYDNISYKDIQYALYTKDIPEPDLFIRTSGEYRIRNFLLLQMAYTELFFSEKMWPEFNADDFVKTIIDFSKRNRRMGK